MIAKKTTKEFSESDNPLLPRLLDFQQDGKAAEIGPHNWAKEPKEFPIVKTKYLDSINTSGEDLIAATDRGVWHFLVGAPGNGKSALVGALVRKLLNSGWAYVDKEAEGATLQYLTRLTSGEGVKKKFEKLRIVQDASVSASPHDPAANLAKELLEVLNDAYISGRSLIICANRGVLEQIPELLTKQPNGSAFQFIKKGIESESEIVVSCKSGSGKQVYKDVLAKFDHLDADLITTNIHGIESSPIQQILDSLVANDGWSACMACTAKRACPFYANREYLRRNSSQEQFLKILRAAETFRGQPIVFREAYALLSTLLAGVPGDYLDLTPCNWVRKQHSASNYFALVDRRIYQVLFSGGLVVNLREQSQEGRERIARTLMVEVGDVRSEREPAASLLEAWPSTISASAELRSSLAALDPVLASQVGEVADFANYDSDALLDVLMADTELWSLEIEAIGAFRKLSDVLQKDGEEDRVKERRISGLRLLTRITGMSLLRLCAMASFSKMPCDFGNENELSEYMKMVDLIRDEPGRSSEDHKWLREMEAMIDDHLRSAAGGDAAYTKVMENLEVKSGAQKNLAPLRLCRQVYPPFLTVGLSFLDTSFSDADLSAQAYCWIRKTQAIRGVAMLPDSIPANLLSGIKVARRNAVSKSEYLNNNDVVLATNSFSLDGQESRITLKNDDWSGLLVEDSE